MLVVELKRCFGAGNLLEGIPRLDQLATAQVGSNYSKNVPYLQNDPAAPSHNLGAGLLVESRKASGVSSLCKRRRCFAKPICIK